MSLSVGYEYPKNLIPKVNNCFFSKNLINLSFRKKKYCNIRKKINNFLENIKNCVHGCSRREDYLDISH